MRTRFIVNTSRTHLFPCRRLPPIHRRGAFLRNAHCDLGSAPLAGIWIGDFLIGLRASLRRRAERVALDGAGPLFRVVMVQVELANIATWWLVLETLGCSGDEVGGV